MHILVGHIYHITCSPLNELELKAVSALTTSSQFVYIVFAQVFVCFDSKILPKYESFRSKTPNQIRQYQGLL